MKTNKTSSIVSIRLDKKEKSCLLKEAKAQRMSLGEYIRVEALGLQEKEHSEHFEEKITKVLDSQWPLLLRLVVSLYFKVGALAEQDLPVDLIAKIKEQSTEEYKKLGIKKD